MTDDLPLWSPTGARTRLTEFRQALAASTGASLPDYDALHAFSLSDPDAFWRAVWSFSDVLGDGHTGRVLEPGAEFMDARWFPEARLNYAENLLRCRDERTALIGVAEEGERRALSYAELYREAARLASAMQAFGIEPGDRVAGYLPNVIETVIAMLAASWLGAIWSSCSPDFGTNGVCDRFGQIAPRLLFVADGYVYGGKRIDCLAKVAEIQGRISDVERIVVVPLLAREPDLSRLDGACSFGDFLAGGKADPPPFARLPFDHPLYIMYSSGTTGRPKCIVHGAGGTLLQHLKEQQLHVDLKPEDVLFYFTTCGWMMWNWLVTGLASGCTVVLYEGSPFAREGRRLLDLIDEEGVSIFGTSAKYLASLESTGIRPGDTHRLEHLRTILSTGSPLNPGSYDFVYAHFKPDVALCSISGGTDIISCFVLGNPDAPIYRGEIQCRGLGMAVEIWNDAGESVTAQKGELVCTQPFPSMPIGFWNDPDGSRYRAAYFERFPGIWAHGDYGEITPRQGIVIHGRSDAVLNPGGVRIGTAEIYRQVERVDEVIDSVVIGQDHAGDVRVVLFVVLREGIELTDDLEDRIRGVIRANATPRHVPEVIVQVPDVPRTISGKIVELAVRNVVHGRPVTNVDALANPEALEAFRDRLELST
ncbi:MAG: acetoacetate--CoA ligase [Gammaproteobacteria bacterium]|nr:MAG: acetoacetate--CoA ligase [Gammaproteobacteria bacterium]